MDRLLWDWEGAESRSEGRVVAEVRLPTRCITDVAFEGTSSRLWITTHLDVLPGEGEEKDGSTKYQGRIFCVDVRVKGHPLYDLKWEAAAGQESLEGVMKL